MGYYISHPFNPLGGADSPAIDEEVRTLRAQLEDGPTAECRRAVLRLVELRAEAALTQCLASSRTEVVQMAANGLWECWLNEAGKNARGRMEEGVDAMNLGNLDGAQEIFTGLAALHPGWAEAINKQATALYLQGRPQQSLELCREVVRLKPNHFGAWNGMAICAIQLEDWGTAFKAVQESLRLQPYSHTNRQLLHLVQSRLQEV